MIEEDSIITSCMFSFERDKRWHEENTQFHKNFLISSCHTSFSYENQVRREDISISYYFSPFLMRGWRKRKNQRREREKLVNFSPSFTSFFSCRKMRRKILSKSSFFPLSSSTFSFLHVFNSFWREDLMRQIFFFPLLSYCNNRTFWNIMMAGGDEERGWKNQNFMLRQEETRELRRDSQNKKK